MQASKFILLIAPEESPLEKLGPTLKQLDFQVSMVRTVEAGIGFMRRVPQLSLVAVDAKARDVVPEAFWELALVHDDLPIMWLASETDPNPKFGARTPQALFQRPLDEDAFVLRAKELLYADFYPSALAQSLVASSNAVMATTFQVPVEVGQPWLKLTGTIPGDVVAFLPFMSDTVVGYVMVSGECDRLAELAQEVGFDPEDGLRRISQEVVGEVANQVVGRLKTDCQSFLGNVRLGLPLLFAGQEMDIRYSSAKPSLCVDLVSGEARLEVSASVQIVSVDMSSSSFADGGEVFLF